MKNENVRTVKDIATFIVFVIFVFAILAAIIIPSIEPAETEPPTTTESTTIPETELNPTIDITEPTETEPMVEETEPDPTEATEVTEPTVVETEPEETIDIPETTEPKPTESTTSNQSASNDTQMSEREMLALVIFQEAGGSGSCRECKKRVGDIVLNRVADSRYPDTIYGVLTQRAQYGRLYWTGLKWADRASSTYEADAVAECYQIADEILSGDHSDVYGKGYIYQSEYKQSKDSFYHCGHHYGR